MPTTGYVLPLHEQLRDLPRKVWAVQAGTAVSPRIRHEAGNSVNVVRYEARESSARRALIERWDDRGKTGLFEFERAHDLELSA